MKNVDRAAKAESFVRQYSFKVAADLPENELAQFLMQNQSLEIARENEDEHGIMSDFNQWLCADRPDSGSSGNEDLQLLFKERKELAETWLKFQAKYREYSEPLLDTRGPPSIETLRSIMKNTAQDWENKRGGGFGRAKEKMIGFSESLVSFADLFSIIPQGDKYVSLFTGVISTTIKAAARHKEIAEGFTSALEEIGKEMNFSTRELRIHRTPKIQRLVIRLYIKHAKFFCHFMTWYLSSAFKRLGTSLRNDFYTKEVQLRVTEIRSVAKEIEQEASLITQRSTQRIETMVQSLGLNLEELMQRADFYRNMDADHLETIDKRLDLVVQAVGQLSRKLIVGHCDYLSYNASLIDAIEPAVDRIESPQPSNCPSHPSETPGDRDPATPTPSPRVLTVTRPGLQQVSRDLQKYYPFTDRGETSHDTRDLATLTVSGSLVAKLKEWLASPRSDLLWIIGSNSHIGNEATLAASHILDIATSAALPCVSFICTTMTDAPHISEVGKTRATTLLIALLYSLISQLLCVVPETFQDTYDLENAIQALKGGEESVKGALEIIQVLLRHRTPLLLVILDGLELLEDDNTIPHLRNLISILHSRQTDSRLKVLLGSQGFLVSFGHLDVDERVDCTLLPRRRPGKPLPGGRLIGDLDSFPM